MGGDFPAHLYFRAARAWRELWPASGRGGPAISPLDPVNAAWAGLALLFTLWYATVALREVYGGSTRVAFRRSVSLLAAYVVVVVMTFAAFVVIALRM